VKRKRSRLLGRVVSAVMSALFIFLSVFNGFDFVSRAEISYNYEDATIVQGKNILYSTFMDGGSWNTHRYTWNDGGTERIVYCIESNKGAPGEGGATYPRNYLADNGKSGEYVDRILLAAAVAHGPGGGLANDGRMWWIEQGGVPELANNEDFMYLITHIAANYAYNGISGNSRDIIYRGVPEAWQQKIDQYLLFLTAVADEECTYRDPACPAGYGTAYTNFWVRIFEPPEGSGYQQMAFAAGQAQKWVPVGMRLRINVNKTTPGGKDLGKSLDGATYGLYKEDGTELDRISLHAPQESGLNPNTLVTGQFNLYLPEFPDGDEHNDDVAKYYIQEITPPAGFKRDTEKHWLVHHNKMHYPGDSWTYDNKITTDDPVFDLVDFNYYDLVTATFIEEEDSLKPDIQVKKAGSSATGKSVRGAVYTLYEYNTSTGGTTEKGKATINTPIGGSEINMSGSFNVEFTDNDVNKYFFIQETKEPTGYLLDRSRFWFKVVKEDNTLKLQAYNPSGALVDGSTVSVEATAVNANSVEKVLHEFTVSVTKRGNSKDPRATLEGAVYTVYDNDDNKIKDIPLTVSADNPNRATGTSGALSQTAGKYYLLETTSPHGYKLDTKKHKFTVNEDGTFTTTDEIFTPSGTTLKATTTDDEDSKPFTPDIEIIKTGSCNLPGDGADISKAKYGLFDSKDKLLQEIELTGTRTRATGSFTYEIKELGSYYIKETYSPEYFDLDPTKFTFEVTLVDDELISTHSDFKVDATDKAKATVRVKEAPNKYRWKVKVVKTADTEGDYTSLNDVVYGLFKEDGTEMQRVNLVGNNTGATANFEAVISDKLEAGNYYVQEVETVPGFRLNPKKYPFEVNVVDQKLVPSVAEIEVLGNDLTVNAVDESEVGKFTFVKRGEDGLAIEGAKFEVYLKSKLTYDDATGDYNWDAVNPYQTLTSDATGKVLSADLNLGTYLIREIEVAPEYILMDPFEVVIDKDLVTVDLGEKTDGNVPIQIRCTKKDSGRDTVVLKAGTTYEIKDSAGNNVVDRSGETQFVCDDTGVILVDAELSPDTYTITEIVPPNAYLADSEPVVVKVDANLNYVIENGIHIHDVEFKNTEKLGEITITKRGKTLTSYKNEKFIWEEAPLPNATFEVRAREDIYSPDNQGTLLHSKDEVVGTIITGNDGTATITDLHLGKYYLVETIAPTGYVLDQTEMDVELKDTDVSIQKVIETTTKFDEKQNVILDLYKFDEETKKPLADAKFGIYAAEDIKNFAGDVIVKKGNILAYASSGKDGKIAFDIDLPFNKFMIKEEHAPFGYVKNTTEYEFDATEPDSKTIRVTYKNEWGNTPVKGDVNFVKVGESLVDFKDGKFIWENTSLKGAEFNLYANEVYTYDHAVDENGNRTTYYKKDQLIQKVVIDENGTAKITDMPIGTYYMIETKAPYGMTVRKNRFDFEIKYKDENTPKVVSNESILNDRQKLSLTVTKKGSDGNHSLSGGKFELYAEEDIVNINGKVIVKKDTLLASAEAKDGKVDFGLDLPHGKYYAKESASIGGYYKTDKIYHLDGTYTSQDIELLAIDCTINNEKIPELGRLVLKMGNKFFQRGENNYITGDVEGTTGYSVLIGEKNDITKSRTLAGWTIYGGMGLAALILAGIAMLIIGKRRKKAVGTSEIRFDESSDGYTDQDFDDGEEI